MTEIYMTQGEYDFITWMCNRSLTNDQSDYVKDCDGIHVFGDVDSFIENELGEDSGYEEAGFKPCDKQRFAAVYLECVITEYIGESIEYYINESD